MSAKEIVVKMTYKYHGYNILRIEPIKRNGENYGWAVLTENHLVGKETAIQEYWHFFKTKPLAEQYILLVEMGENNFCFGG